MRGLLVLGDLEIAKQLIEKEYLTLCIVKDEHVLFQTSSHGISGFLNAIHLLDGRLADASVADKVVGKAIALLCLYSKVRAVYGNVMSRGAKSLFEENMVRIEYDELVDSILGDCRSGKCPFEALADSISDPEEAYKKLKRLQDSLRQRR